MRKLSKKPKPEPEANLQEKSGIAVDGVGLDDANGTEPSAEKWTELDNCAREDKELPDGLSGSETLYFLAMRNLYRYAGMKGMDEAERDGERKKIAESVRRYGESWRLVESAAKQRNATSGSRAEYRKARKAGDLGRAIEAADRICAALDGVPM